MSSNIKKQSELETELFGKKTSDLHQNILNKINLEILFLKLGVIQQTNDFSLKFIKDHNDTEFNNLVKSLLKVI